MKINKKDLKLPLETKNISVDNLFTGNILTYSDFNSSGSFVGNAIMGPIILFVQNIKGQYQPLTNFLWEEIPNTYENIENNPTYVKEIVINVRPYIKHCKENNISYDIRTFKELFLSLKALNQLEKEQRKIY